MAAKKFQPVATDQVEGRNPVLEALRGPREVYEVYLAKIADRSAEIEEIIKLARRGSVPLKDASRERIDAMARTRAPQGVIAMVEPYKYLDLAEMLQRVEAADCPLVLALDGVEDPQNLGAILRVAETAGVDVVVIPGKRSAGVTAVVAKASAGAVEHVTMAQISSMPAALERLKGLGLLVVGAEAEGGSLYYEIDMTVPMAIVLGGEGKGLGRLVRERCDEIARLPLRGKVTSLNVATTGSVLLFEALRQRATCQTNRT
ncbi:MAG: 23S rRNA (guanosine(2251)-2'-O)-methyltransferase RlmB [Candidatus Geothermincolia bacterium]